MKKILNKIKLFLKKIFVKEESVIVVPKQKPEVIDLYPNIVPGTIIRAARDNICKSYKNLLGHDEGPFLVVSKTNYNFVCAYGTGVCNPDIKQYKINGLKYNLNKATYFNLNNIELISHKRFIKIIDKLTDEDYNDFLKELLINKGNYYSFKQNNVRVKLTNISLSIGDVYYSGNKYFLIIDIKDNKYVCLSFNGDYKSLNNLNYDQLHYNKITNSIKIVNKFDSKYIDLIKEKYYLLQNKNDKEIKRGSIISDDNDIYYVYGEEGDSFLVFPLYYDKGSLYDELIIDNEIMYTDYSDGMKIMKKDNKYKMVKQLNESQIDEIKRHKKSYHKRNNVFNYNDNKAKKLGKNIKEGYVIKTKNKKYFYVYNVDDDYLYLVQIYPKKSYINNYFSINNMMFTSNFNTQLCMNKDQSYNVFAHSKPDEIEIINNLMCGSVLKYKVKDEQVEEKKSNAIDRGSVIEYLKHYYYIYGEISNHFVTYELFFSYDKKNMKKLKINNQICYTDFKDSLKFPNDGEYNLVFKLSDDKIMELKKIKREWIKSKKMEAIHTLEEGSIVYKLPDVKTKYLLIIKNDGISSYIRYDERNKHNAKIYYFVDSEVKTVDKFDNDLKQEIIDINNNIKKQSFQKIKK